jgi:outer membrane protein OmpA-like peptidoglycan-associated protein
MRGSKFIWIGAVVAVLTASAGCATKGYVRTQVADLRNDVESKNATMRTDLDQVRGDNARALAMAGVAQVRADSSRYLALGNVDYREAARYQVYFAFNRADLDDEAKTNLNAAAHAMEANPQYLGVIYGLADPRGSDDYNLQLGQRRADAVLRYLAQRTPAQLLRFGAVSFGETPPDIERASWGEDYKHQRQVLLLLVERIPPSARHETLTSR